MTKQTAVPKLSTVINLGIRNADALTEDLRERLVSILTTVHAGHSFNDLLEKARELLARFEPVIAHVISETELAGWILGAHAVVNKLPADLALTLRTGLTLPGSGPPSIPVPPVVAGTPAPVPILRLPIVDHAVDDMSGRQIVTRHQFDQLSQSAKSQAFTVARQNSHETIGKIRDAVRDAVLHGDTLDDFRDRLTNELITSPIGPGHDELIFRQAVMTSYSNGQERIVGHPIVKPIFPFSRILPIHDARTRKTHLSLEKTGLEGTGIYWSDDFAFWRIFTPPMDFSCRCDRAYLTREQAAELGLKLAQEWIATGIEPDHESRLPFIDWRPSPQFVNTVQLAV